MYFELPEEPPGLPDGSSAKGVYFIFEKKICSCPSSADD